MAGSDAPWAAGPEAPWAAGPDAPWAAGSGSRAPRRPAWGCLAAVVVGTIGLIVAVVLAAKLADTALSGVHIR